MWQMAIKRLFTTFRSLNFQHNHGKLKSWHGRQKRESKESPQGLLDPWGVLLVDTMSPLATTATQTRSTSGTKAWFYDSWHFGPQQGRNIGVETPNKARASKGWYLLWEYFLEQFHLPEKCQQELIFLDQVTQKHPCVLHGHCPVFPCGPGAPKQSWTSLALTPSQFSSVQLLSSVRLFVTPMNCSTPGLPVHHQLPEFTQTHVHQVGAISSSVVPFSSCP